MKKGIKVLFKTISLSICLLFAASFFSACARDGTKSSAYSIFGYVYDEYGSPVEGVTISSDFGSSVTDKEGKYTFSNVEGSIVLSPSIKGYHFEEVSKYVKNASDDANFVAYKEYTVSGTAHNNSVAVPHANIKLSSLAGEFYTMTDEQGCFTVSGVAGTTTVSCEVDGVEFYSTSASFDAPNVSISTTSSLTINVASDDQIDLTKVELWLDGAKLLFANSQKVIQNVRCGSLVELKSDYYHFDKPATFVVDELNQVESFNLNRIYSLSGIAKSGSTPLENANIFVDGKLASTTSQTGSFSLDGLWGERVVTAEYSGFEFNSELVNFEDISVIFSGSKQITLDILLDFAGEEDIVISKPSTKREDGTYEIQKVSLGETVYLSSINYYLDETTFVVGDSNHYTVTAQKYYELEIYGINGIDANILVDGENFNLGTINKLYGEHTVSATYENYVFTSDVVNAGNPAAILEYKNPHSVTFTVSTGSLLLQDAIVSVGDNYALTSELGEVTLNNVFVGDTIQISKNGYNVASVIYDGEDELFVNLTFNISGHVLTGEEIVEQAEVSVGNIKTTTNNEGFFEIKNLEGDIVVVASKEGFVFESKTTNVGNNSFVFNGTYTVSGKIEADSLEGYVVKFINTSSGNEQEQNIDANGEYSVSGLAGRYLVYVVDENDDITLNPATYEVYSSMICNFSSGGFSVEGYVKTGTEPVAYAKVTAGAISVYTDASGYYKFELLTSACDISVSKAGYTFSQAIRVEEDTTDANFSATYTVSGRTVFGEEGVSGVSVYFVGEKNAVAVTNSSGEFVIEGISGAKVLEFKKVGYVFETQTNISGYSSTIVASSKIVATISITSGGLEIASVDCFVNGTKVGTADSHEISLTLAKGDIVSFEKTGYVISDVTISNTRVYIASASYSVSASVACGGVSLTGYEVCLNGEITKNVVVSGNTFTISGVVGNNVILVQKNGYVFESQTISEASTIIFNGTYTISGNVFVGNKPLAGVVVVAGGKEGLTDENGEYLISGLSGKVSVSASKEGYGFDSYSNKIGEQTLTFDASYTLSGIVKTGDIVIALADVCVVIEGSGTQYTAKTDNNGSFMVSGIRGNANIIVSKDGYTSATFEGFADYTKNIECNLTYSYLIKFDFTALSGVVENITVYLNDEPRIVAGGSINFTNLSGKNTIRFEASSRKFAVNNLEVKQPSSQTVGVYPSYDISGYVKAEIGHAISNVKVMNESGAYCFTDENGYYSLSDIAGAIYVDDASITKDPKSVASSGEYNFTVANSDFAFMLYDKANANLDASSSVQIYGSGSVFGDTSVMDTTQYVYAVYKRDQNGNVIKQKLNYGETVNAVIMTVDPKVSLVVVGTNNSGTMSWEYQVLRKEGNVTSTTTANHTTAGLSEITYSGYQGTYGSYPDAYSSYVINRTTASLSSLTYDSGSQTYTVVFRSPMSSQGGYQKEIVQLAPSGTTYLQNSSSFSQITIKISKSGWIKQVDAHDEYKINQTMEVKVTSDVSYIYYTDKPNYHIDLISRNNINGSLVRSEQREVEMFGYKKYDIVSKTIYGI